MGKWKRWKHFLYVKEYLRVEIKEKQERSGRCGTRHVILVKKKKKVLEEKKNYK